MKFRKQSLTDMLTGLPNRRYLDEFLKISWNRNRRDGNPTTLIMLDIDYFKNYNDTYGHQAGDEVLVEVAETLNQQILRSSDFIARYGGEEFMAVLYNVEAEGARIIAEKFCLEIENLHIPNRLRDDNQYLTISCGVTCVSSSRDISLSEAVKKTDELLYAAKENGRNRYELLVLEG